MDWWPDWRGQTCVIVASGPSAKDADLEAARGRAKVIAINNSWHLAPWADVLYACDWKWWREAKGAAGFGGLKIVGRRLGHAFPAIREISICGARHEILTAKKGVIGSGGNGGFQALNLAVQFGCKQIVIVGYDMRIDRGAHWHGPHGRGLNNPTAAMVAKWARAFDDNAPRLADLGVEVLNASPVSALAKFRKVNLLDVLGSEIARDIAA